MKFFIDTANLEQIREAYDLGVLDGVTTNPSLMAKEGIKGVENQRKHYVDICNIVQGDVSAEVIATDYEGMIKEGEELAALNPHKVSRPLNTSRAKVSVQIVLWYFLSVRHCLQPRQVQRMFLRLWGVSMTSVRMALHWLRRL